MLRTIATIVALVLVVGFLAFRSIRRAEDPARQAFKWLLSIGLAIFYGWYAWPMVDQGGQATFSAIAIAIVCSLILFITWRNEIGNIASFPLTSLFDGGNLAPELKPFYSIAIAKQKKGLYEEAIAEIRKQLERFPTDREGQMLLAQILVENLKDLPGAEQVIQDFCAQSGHAPANIAFALYSLADWHLKYGADRDAACQALEQVLTHLPDTEFALTAAQRIAHIKGEGMRMPGEEPKKFNVTEGVRNFGLLKESPQIQPAEKEPGQLAAEYVRHLQKFPLDTEAREKLAILYVDHYHRLDLAADQLEQMIQQPNRPVKLVAHWLNLLVDLQLRSGADYDTLKHTLERIIALAPNLAVAETARKRIGRLKLELKVRDENRSVQMGNYEQNLGLKFGRPDSA